jgi:all-trans-8'-apo-beta-carotenal 15,15'-oxygenase
MSFSPAVAQTAVATKSYNATDWQGGTKSLTTELDYEIDDIEGQIPLDLRGTLFRNGPGILDIGGVSLRHPFDGDGMICAIAFNQGKAHFRNRFVRTEGYLAEQAAGKILYRGVFGTQKPGGWAANIFDIKFKSIANTNVLYWGDKLWALWEADRPYRLDPATLETLGEESFDGQLTANSPFSAHPRIDPGDEHRPPRLVNFAVKAGLSTTIVIYELDVQGQIVEQHQHTVPGFAFIHDFALTPNYCIFFQNPVQFNPLPFVLGLRGPGECIRFQPKQPTRVWVIPRHGRGKAQCLETDSCFVFHHVNAFEQGESLVVDSICYENFPTVDPEQDYRQIDFDALPPGQLWRFEINPSTQTVKRQHLSDRCCEFPVIHPQKVGQDYRYAYLAIAHAPVGNAPLQALMKLDVASGQTEIWSAAPRGFMGEPVFVPKKLGAATSIWQAPMSAEDQGWILSVVYDAAHHRSDVVILDGAAIAQGPVARLHLKHHIPYGLHGNFTPKLF